MRRRTIGSEVEQKPMIATGTFIGNGLSGVTITHNLGAIPKVFAFLADHNGETEGTMAGAMINTEVPTAYTTTITKTWTDSGAIFKDEGKAQQITPGSMAYGVTSMDENKIVVSRYAASQNFVQGKEYSWIAISDWR